MNLFNGYGNNGIEKMEKTMEEIKDFINKNVTAMEVIEQPESVIICDAVFSLFDGYIQNQKEIIEKLDRIDESLKYLEKGKCDILRERKQEES